MRTAAFAAAIAALLGSAAAEAAVGPWAEGDKARVRLIATVAEDGRLDGAIEIELEPRWKTYWRSPGDAGISPGIDFSASENLSDPQVSFPPPRRYSDGYGQSNVYEDRVLLPFTARLTDAAAKVALSLSLDIGVCESVCVPEHFSVALDVPAGEADAESRQIIAAARALLPGPREPGVAAIEAVARTGGAERKPEYELTLSLSDPAAAEVYVEGPADWYAGAPELLRAEPGRAVYRVAFDRLGAKTPIDGATLRVTMVLGDRAVEDTIGLD